MARMGERGGAFQVLDGKVKVKVKGIALLFL